jgi:hypothetical protein
MDGSEAKRRAENANEKERKKNGDDDDENEQPVKFFLMQFFETLKRKLKLPILMFKM